MRTMSSYGVCVGRMLSPIGQNTFFSCSRFNTEINKLSKLTVTQMRRHYQSALNDELVSTTSVLLELLFIRDVAYSFDFNTDDVDSGPPSQKAECNNTFSLQLTLTLTLTLAPTPFAMADLCDGGPPPKKDRVARLVQFHAQQ